MINRFLLIILTGLFGVTHLLPAQVTVLPDDSRFEYTGRLDFSNPRAPVIGFSGVVINCKFTGTSVKVRFNSRTTTNYYYYSIDESEPVKINLAWSTHDYLLANSLSDTIHNLTLTRLTEGSQGNDIFEGIILNSGDSLVTMSPKNRKSIEFYGNSITCGYGNESNNTADGFKPEQENFYLTYASVASRMLDADCIGICRSGIGMYRNYAGPVTGSSSNMLTIYDNILVNDNSKKWDFTGHQPDVVCINLGTNDTSNDLFDESIFSDSCKSLLVKLRSHYPDAYIVYLTGPMVSDANRQKITTAVQTVFDELNDPKLSMFHMSRQTGDLGLGGDYHPTVAQHRENGLELTAYLEELTGWFTAPYFLNARVAPDGMSVQVKVSEALEEIPHQGGIRILVDGEPAVCTSARLSESDESIFNITLSERIRQDQDVTVTYRNGEITSKNQVRLQPFYNREVVNPVKETNVISASVNQEGDKVSVIFNKSLAGVLADSFQLMAEGEGVKTFSDVSVNPGNDREVLINTDDHIFNYQVIRMDISGGAVTGLDGVPNESAVNCQVENNSLLDDITVPSVTAALAVFPNPTADRFSIAGKIAGSVTRVEIYDRQGKLAAKYSADPGGSYDMTRLAEGVYFCRIYFTGSPHKFATVKIVKR